jgi:hypothetical protein
VCARFAPRDAGETTTGARMHELTSVNEPGRFPRQKGGASEELHAAATGDHRFGRIGRACGEAIAASDDFRVAGIVRRPRSLAEPVPAAPRGVPVAAHASELGSFVRWGTSAGKPHQRFLLEARFDFPSVTAQVMMAAARALPRLVPGAHRLCDLPSAALLPVDVDY